MTRHLGTMLAAAGCLLAVEAPAHAQVFIRAPFVRLQVGGGGVAVRAPFVRYYAPPVYYAPPAYYAPPPVYYAPPSGYTTVRIHLPAPSRLREPEAPVLPAPAPLPAEQTDNAVVPDDPTPPAPQAQATMTLEQFAKAFRPKAGSYEVDVLNPVTRQPAKVRFTLPEGTPQRVDTGANNLEFVYGPRQFVRIEFDRDGALVTSR